MNIEQISIQIPEYARDCRLNLQTVMKEAGAPGLTQRQIFAIALASSYASGNKELSNALCKESSVYLDEAEQQAAKTAHSIMAMNTIYYRFTHTVAEEKLSKLPARLRMNGIAKPGIDSITFELMCLAISIINGCSMCIKSHTQTLQQQALTDVGIQSTARIAAVIHAVAKTL